MRYSAPQARRAVGNCNYRKLFAADLQRLAESLLRLVMLVTLPLVEFVRAFTDHVRSQVDAAAAMPPRPFLSGFQQPRTGAQAPLSFGNYEPVHLRSRVHFHEIRDANVQPADQIPGRSLARTRILHFRDEQGMSRRGRQLY